MAELELALEHDIDAHHPAGASSGRGAIVMVVTALGLRAGDVDLECVVEAVARAVQ